MGAASTTTVLVLGDRDDPTLQRLAPPAAAARPAGPVRFVFGERPEDFGADVETAAAVLSWWRGREALDPVLAQAARLRWIHASAAGLDHLWSPALSASTATLTNSRGVYGEALGEYVLAAMLFFAKDIPRLRDSQKRRAWDPFEGERLAGKVLGIVGYGDIGREIARRATAFDMEVLAFRRRPRPADADGPTVRLADSLDETLRASDYAVVALPLTPDTERLIGARQIACLRPHAVLINVGRGRLIDEPALIAALRTGALRGAALDVFETEPLPPAHPLWEMSNVLLSPHSADRVAGWLDRTLDLFLDNLDRFLAGRPLLNVVNIARGY